MTAPSAGRDDATIRGAVVLVVFIVIGLALLARSGGGGGDDDDASSDRGSETTEATTTAAGGESTTVPIQDSSTTASTAPTGSTQDPATINVVVLNATGVGGWAGENADILSAAGYVTGQGNFGGDEQGTTTIYATPEAQADAQAVASLLDLADAPVTQKPAEPLGAQGEDADAQVVVVLGADSTTDAAEGETGDETATTTG